MKKILFYLLCLNVYDLSAQVIDNTFNTFETNIYDNDYNIDGGVKAYVFPNGHSLVFKKINLSSNYSKVVKLDENGIEIPSFCNSGCNINFPEKIYGNDINDKSIVVSGNSDNSHRLTLLNSDGTLDATFNSLIFTNVDNSLTYINKVIFQNDGKIMVVGQFNRVNNENYNNVVRLNSNGTIDSSFNTGTGFSVGFNIVSYCMSIIQLSDNKYIVVGYFYSYNGSDRKYIIKLNADGSVDTSFNIVSTTASNGGTIGFSEFIKDIIKSPYNDSFYTIGPYYYVNGNPVTKGIAKFNSNGTRDASFNVSNLYGYFPSCIAFQSDGKIVTDNLKDNGNICRLNTNGTFDSTFNFPLTFKSEFNKKITALTDGKILIAGNLLKKNLLINAFGSFKKLLFKINNTGSVDLTYRPSAGLDLPELYNNSWKSSSLILNSNNIIIHTSSLFYNDTDIKNIFKINQNGVLNTNFNISNNIYLNNVIKIIKSDNYSDKIYLISDGNNLVNNSVSSIKILRINENGEIDNTFNINLSNESISANTAIIDSNEKLLLTGSSNMFKVGNLFKIVRFNMDGSIDLTFNSPLYSGAIKYIKKLSDGKLLVNSENNNIQILNPNGTIFNMLSNVNISNLERILISDNDIIYLIYDTSSGKIVYKMNVDGTFDSLFNNISIINNFYETNFYNSDNLIIDNVVYNSLGNVLFELQGITFGTKIISQNCTDLVLIGDFYNIYNRKNSGIIRLNTSNITPAPTPIANSLQYFNQGQTLNSLIVNGQNLNWYSLQYSCSSNSGGRYSVESLPNTTLLENNKIYYVSQTVNGIESSYRLPIKVVDNASLFTHSFVLNNIYVFPNPTCDFFTVSSNVEFDEIYIYNSIGQLINKIKKSDKYDISNFERGIYFIQLKLDEKEISKIKLIKN